MKKLLKLLVFTVYTVFVALPLVIAAGLTFLTMTWRDFACRNCVWMNDADHWFYALLKGKSSE